MKRIATLTAPFLFFALSSFAGNKERLIGTANYTADSNSTLHIVDSFAISYVNGRGSGFDPNTLSYYLNTGNFTTDLYEAEMVGNNVIQTHGMPRVSFDSLIYFQASGNGISAKPKAIESVNYNVDSSYASVEYLPNLTSGSSSVTARQALVYDDNLLSAIYLIVQINNRTDTINRRFLIRNASGQIVTDSTVQYTRGATAAFDYGTTRRFTYNAAGQYINETDEEAFSDPTFVLPGNTYDLTYYADGRVHTYRNNGSSNYFIDTFSYTPGVEGYTAFTRTVYNYGSNTSNEKYTYTCHLNAANQKDSTFYTSYLNGTSSLRTEYVIYDVGGYPTEITTWNTAGGNTRLQGKSYYYYYKDSTSGPVNPLSVPLNRNTGAIIYPNPTHGLITLRATSKDINGECVLHIANPAGQIVHSEAITLQGTKQVDLGADVPAGNYYLNLTDRAGKILFSQLLTKL